MKYYLDTNICIYLLKDKYIKLNQKILSQNPDNIKIPAIVKAKLLYRVEKNQRRNENIKIINQFLFPIEIVGFNNAASIEYSKIRSDLEKEDEIIDSNDLIIASIVKSNDGIIITNNVKEFERVKGLKIENWVI